MGSVRERCKQIVWLSQTSVVPGSATTPKFTVTGFNLVDIDGLGIMAMASAGTMDVGK